ncbi:uncharacterized protein LOC135829886 [Sycon ciliatum]|uniref:uncharacterized protein LOC135829886 n=1 Tax=Sycon ciliatum TaxID=27933 RepID=UPI0031F6DB3E
MTLQDLISKPYRSRFRRAAHPTSTTVTDHIQQDHCNNAAMETAPLTQGTAEKADRIPCNDDDSQCNRQSSFDPYSTVKITFTQVGHGFTPTIELDSPRDESAKELHNEEHESRSQPVAKCPVYSTVSKPCSTRQASKAVPCEADEAHDDSTGEESGEHPPIPPRRHPLACTPTSDPEESSTETDVPEVPQRLSSQRCQSLASLGVCTARLPPVVPQRTASKATGLPALPLAHRKSNSSAAEATCNRNISATSTRNQCFTANKPVPSPRPVALVKPTAHGIIVNKSIPQPYSVVILNCEKKRAASPDDDGRERLASDLGELDEAAGSARQHKLLEDQLVSFSLSPSTPRQYASISRVETHREEDEQESTKASSSQKPQTTTPTKPMIRSRKTQLTTVTQRAVRREASQEEYISMNSLNSLPANNYEQQTSNDDLYTPVTASCPPSPYLCMKPTFVRQRHLPRSYSSEQDLFVFDNDSLLCMPARHGSQDSMLGESLEGDWSSASNTLERMCPVSRNRSCSVKSLPVSGSGTLSERMLSVSVSIDASAHGSSGEGTPPRKSVILRRCTPVQLKRDQRAAVSTAGRPLRRVLGQESLLASSIPVGDRDKSTKL